MDQMKIKLEELKQMKKFLIGLKELMNNTGIDEIGFEPFDTSDMYGVEFNVVLTNKKWKNFIFNVPMGKDTFITTELIDKMLKELDI